MLPLPLRFMPAIHYKIYQTSCAMELGKQNLIFLTAVVRKQLHFLLKQNTIRRPWFLVLQ